MGMFDSLIVRCPECGKNIEFQSKEGDCLLAEYRLDNCPTSILNSLANTSETCECGKEITLRVRTFATIE